VPSAVKYFVAKIQPYLLSTHKEHKMNNVLWKIIITISQFFQDLFGKRPAYEEILDKVDFSNPEELREAIQDKAFQDAAVSWVNDNLRPLEDDQAYLKVAQGNWVDELFHFSTDVFKEIFARFNELILLGTPAHELGHHIFDGLGGTAIVSDDPFIAKAYRNEIDAAILGAMFHDASTGVQHRYVDNEWGMNHGELASLIFFFLTKGLIPENTHLIASYAIAAHPHMLKSMTAKNGAVREPWEDHIFYNGETPVRIAVWVTRWTDRLENGGDPATHFPRHALATVDGALVNGFDLHKVDWYSFSDGMRYLFTPRAEVNEVEGKKIPTMLQHLKGYANSAIAVPCSAYNQHDEKSPNMVSLMARKVKSSTDFIDIVTNTTGDPDFEKFVKLMTIKSGSPLSEANIKAIEMLRDLWNKNTPEDQAHWAQGFDFALVEYYRWLTVLQTKIGNATDPTVKAFMPLVSDLVKKVM